MARKKRKKKEEYQFEVPDFDEAEFMRKEILWAKAAVVTVGYAFAIGAACFGLSIVGFAYLAPLVGLGALYGLRYLYPAAKIDTSKFDRKVWAGNGATFLFAWLAFWVLLLNPPFVDVSPPVIQRAKVGFPGDSLDDMVEINLAEGQIAFDLGSNTSVQVLVLVTDNVGVVRVEATLDGGEAASLPVTANPHWYRLTISPAQEGELYVVVVRAVDQQNLWSNSQEIRIVTS